MGIKDFSIKVKSLHCWRPLTDRETPRSITFVSYFIKLITADVKNYFNRKTK